MLRGVAGASAEEVAAAAESLRAHGMINYYGLQRFGTGAVPTHAVGAALLCGRWEAAVRLLMTPQEDGRAEVVEACNAYLERGDAAAAARRMPRYHVAETALLQVGRLLAAAD